MNLHLQDLLKINILCLVVYSEEIPIEELLLLQWKDIMFKNTNVILKINEKEFIVKDEYICLFLRELSEQTPLNKNQYLFLK